MDRNVIFFDIDGTLLHHEIGYVRQYVKDTIKRVQDQGHYCFIASGRPWGYIAKEIRNINFDGFVLGNGSHVRFHNQDMSIRTLNYNDVKEMIEIFNKNHIEYVLDTSTYCYMKKSCECLLEFYSHCHIDFNNFCFEYDEDEVLKRVIKIEVWVKDENELSIVKEASQSFICEVHPDPHSLEIYSKEVSKATGILDVMEQLNIPLEHTYCFGDGPNDIEMFETVGHPIAMGNALDIIKEKAERVCLSVLEDGVAKELEELFLKDSICVEKIEK